MKVCNLIPGAIFEKGMCLGLLSYHPVWPHLSLVIWIMEDNRVIFDALSPDQELGEPTAILNRREIKTWIKDHSPEWTMIGS